MKKGIILSVIIFIIVNLSMSSQELGLRLGDISGGNVAIDGIFSTGKFSRIHADASFGNGLGIDALWDFLYRPLGSEAFDWYVGAGPFTYLSDDFFLLGGVGEIGIEYHFMEIPLVIGADFRPYISLVEETDFTAGFGINIRYVFK